MLSTKTVTSDTLSLLKELSPLTEPLGMRLVGGTALALQLGHRQSIDLDFFTHNQIDQELLLQALRAKWNITITNRTPSILQTIINGIKVDFVQYPYYEWIDNPITEDGITLASPTDIAAMKINAIIGRGSKKDFIDIFVLLQHFTLSDIIEFYKKKYPDNSEYMAMLSLTYFDDADIQDTPTLFINDSWEQMKKHIVEAVKQFQQS